MHKGQDYSFYQYFNSSFCAVSYRNPRLRPAGEADSLHRSCFADPCGVSSSLPLSLLHAAELPPATQPCPTELPRYTIRRKAVFLSARASCPRSLPSPRPPRFPSAALPRSFSPTREHRKSHDAGNHPTKGNPTQQVYACPPWKHFCVCVLILMMYKHVPDQTQLGILIVTICKLKA